MRQIHFNSIDADKLAQDTVDLLNEAFAADPTAIESLFSYYNPCNRQLAGHPTIQVKNHNNQDYLSLIGIINGILGKLINRKVCAVWDYDEGEMARLLGFRVLIEVPETALTNEVV